MIDIGNIEAEGVWVGATKATSVFIGDTEVWKAYTPIPTRVKYTSASGYPDWEGLIEGTITGSGTTPTTQIPNVTSAEQIVLGEQVNRIGESAFRGCSSLLSVDYSTAQVSAIAGGAYYGCGGLTDITIPDTVTSIGNYAFRACTGISSVVIGSGVTSMGKEAFRGCTGLSSVTIPAAVATIGEDAFRGCSALSSVTMTGKDIDTVKGMTNYSWSLANGTKVYCTNGYITIGGDDTYYTKVKYTATSGFPDWEGDIVGELSSTSIPNITYAKEIETGSQVTGIANNALSGNTNITDVTIGDSVTRIGAEAFRGSGLSSLSIGNGVTSIGAYAFRNCSGLTSVTIPDSVTTIGNSAFGSCSNLMSVTFSGKDKATVQGLVRYSWGLSSGCVIHCTDGDITL